MGLIRKIAKNTQLALFEHIYTDKININIDKAIFSFTFDDVPLSAARNGAKILEDAGAVGTYYVALGIGRSERTKERFIDEEDIKSLHDRGHDIGCHTYSHLSLRKNSPTAIEQDCLLNTNKLKSILGKESIDHFAYPYGAVSLSGKKLLGRRYKTLRTTDYGINNCRTDLTHLRTVSLCSINFDRNLMLETIQKAVKTNGWIIFFTHDILEKPSQWGTSINDFKWVVNECFKTSGNILDISKAYSYINKHSTG
jgi:peptidoglycan/xylan/chitin deacetylase (PgdA/CDA1 family)